MFPFDGFTGNSVYSFSDLTGVISHPLMGAFPLSGHGTGTIEVSMALERTSMEPAMDGSAFVLRVPGDYGSIRITCHQTSHIHKWLLAWYNKIINAQARSWVQTAAILRTISENSGHDIKGIAPQKNSDKAYKETGDMVTWSLMAAEIQSV